MNFSRILVRATNWVGDAVMSLPALHALRQRFPDAHISILARPWVADLYAREPFCDRLLPYTAARGFRDSGPKWKLARSLRAEGFDCAILLQNAFEAALLVRVAGIPRRIGYKRDGRGFLLTDPVPVPKKGAIRRHESHYYLELLRRSGILHSIPEVSSIRLAGAERARQAGELRFQESGIHGPVVGVSPGAAYGSAKRWLPERFADASRQVAQAAGASIALFGSAEERVLCESVAAMAAGPGCRVENWAGRTSLREFIELAAACTVFLTNDSGAMHVASALGVPTVAVFGATDHIATGPTGLHSRVIRQQVHCSPCLLRECPIDHRCMTRVPSDRVAEAALELLK